ncbi:MAG: hypothetical protein K2M97_06400, partial [Muribaculaceae bacterium]|nr:hypothetical protein [Muribaculaceae bacterium]
LNGVPQTAPIGQTYELETQPGDKVFVAYGDTPAPPSDNLDEIAAAELDFTVIDRTITAVCSTNVSSIKVYDLQGRQVAVSSTSSVTVPASAGHMVLVTVTTAGGTTVSHKVAVK